MHDVKVLYQTIAKTSWDIGPDKYVKIYTLVCEKCNGRWFTNYEVTSRLEGVLWNYYETGKPPTEEQMRAFETKSNSRGLSCEELRVQNVLEE